MERDGAVFDHHRSADAIKKAGERLAERVRGHRRIIRRSRIARSDRWTRGMVGFVPRWENLTSVIARRSAMAFCSWDNCSERRR